MTYIYIQNKEIIVHYANQILLHPQQVIEEILSSVPLASIQLLSRQDADYFLEICRNSGKPVPFIPILDQDFEYWFKKDSLWYSENLGAVIGGDPERVLVLQGPVSASYITTTNEPIADILEGICQKTRDILIGHNNLEFDTNAYTRAIFSSRSLIEHTIAVETLKLCIRSMTYLSYKSNANQEGFDLIETVPWLLPVLLSCYIVDRSTGKWEKNPLHTLLQLPIYRATISQQYLHIWMEDECIEWRQSTISGDMQNSPSIKLALLGCVRLENDYPALELELSVFCNGVNSCNLIIPLFLVLGSVTCTIQFDNTEWVNSVRCLYAQRWLGITSDLETYSIFQKQTDAFVVTPEQLNCFDSVTKLGTCWNLEANIPIQWNESDLVLVLAWKPIAKLLLSREISMNLLQLLHTSHQTHTKTCSILKVGQHLNATAEIVGLNRIMSGLNMLMYIEIRDAESKEVLCCCSCEFLFRGDTQHIQSHNVILGEIGQIRAEKMQKISDMHEKMSNVDSKRLVLQKFCSVPLKCSAYSSVSGDHNPIHDSASFAVMANLPHIVMHGAWTCATIKRQFVESWCDGVSSRILQTEFNFINPVKPGSQLKTNWWHVGMINGNYVIEFSSIETKESNTGEQGEKTDIIGREMMRGKFVVAPPSTAILFTGQGSSFVGMGMDIYERDPFARQIWERSEATLKYKYGVSLLDIVRNNPRELVIHFGGKDGKRIRSNYISLFVSIGIENYHEGQDYIPNVSFSRSKLVFSSSEGLLFATQFTQPALVAFSAAWWTSLNSRNLVPKSVVFAGHSLGEYIALLCMCELISLEELIELVFMRGISMQYMVDLHSTKKMKYGMVAADPSRVGNAFGAETLKVAVDQIQHICGRKELCEIVNYNVVEQQYIVAGSVGALEILRCTCDIVHKQGAQILFSTKEEQTKRIQGAISTAKQLIDLENVSELRRGIATLPLSGVDMPFHSRLMLSGVATMRRALLKIVKKEAVQRSLPLLLNKYIPNLVGMPFCLSKSFVEHVQQRCKSPFITTCLENWPTDKEFHGNRSDFENYHWIDIAHILLIELLSYQFASPVLWIDTQNSILMSENSGAGVCRLVEIGPRPILVNMAKRMINMEEHKCTVIHACTKISMQDLCFSQNFASHQDIRPECNSIDLELVELENSEDTINIETDKNLEKELVVKRMSPKATCIVPVNKTKFDIEDDVLVELKMRALLAIHFGIPLHEIVSTTTIKTLARGNSALENEAVSMLEEEFSYQLLDNAAEQPLARVCQRILNAICALAAKIGSVSKRIIIRAIQNAVSKSADIRTARDRIQERFLVNEKEADVCLLLSASLNQSSKSIEKSVNWIQSGVHYLEQATGMCLSITIDESSQPHTMIDNDKQRDFKQNILSLNKSHCTEESKTQEKLTNSDLYVDIDTSVWSCGDFDTEGRPISAQFSTHEVFESVRQELGDAFIEAINPCYSSEQNRSYTSIWNWALQDAWVWLSTLLLDQKDDTNGLFAKNIIDGASDEIFERMLNRADNKTFEFLKSFVNHRKCSFTVNINEQLQNALSKLIEVVNRPPTYVPKLNFVGPSLQIDQNSLPLPEDGLVFMNYTETERDRTTCTEEYLEEMKSGLISSAKKIPISIRNRIVNNIQIQKSDTTCGLPFLSLKLFPALGDSPCCGDEALHASNDELNSILFQSLHDIARNGLSLSGTVALVCGCGKGSLGIEMVKILLSAGATVLTIRSSAHVKVYREIQEVYQKFAGRGAILHVIPCNMASIKDIKSAVAYIYDKLALDVDIVLPFSAFVCKGRPINRIDSHTEVGLRVMLTNVERLLGMIQRAKESMQNVATRPAIVLLPLSPNHGTFGGDGLYAESKLGLEALLQKCHSESWYNSIIPIGAVIGWTRTSLMTENDAVAAVVEDFGLRTFSPSEMAFNLSGLMHPDVIDAAISIGQHTLVAHFDGGFSRFHQLGDLVKKSLQLVKSSLKTVSGNSFIEINTKREGTTDHFQKLANISQHLPMIPCDEIMSKLPDLVDLFDLDRVVVVTGCGEVGPWGSCRTRWEMEAYGEFSLEGVIELAWVTGLIVWDSSKKHWCDSQTQELVLDHEIKSKYEEILLQHSGIRLVDPRCCDGYDPVRYGRQGILHQVALMQDLEPFEVSSMEEAREFVREHGSEHLKVRQSESGKVTVQFLAGAMLFIPKALRFDRLVAGQLPRDWNACLFGLPAEIKKQVDPVTVMALVATAEALIHSGISDINEMYHYVHLRDIGITVGSGIGGAKSLRRMYRDRLRGEQVASDVLQETFVNTIAAWINMLLIGGCGPIKTPSGACATAAQSFDMGVELIQMKKAAAVIVGAADDFTEDVSFEFARMRATIDSTKDKLAGRGTTEASRPTSSTRNGFVGSQGAGIQILMSAALATKMGCPIRAVVATCITACDGVGRSVPAPGQGLANAIRPTTNSPNWKFTHSSIEISTSNLDSVLLRQASLRTEFRRIECWRSAQLNALQVSESITRPLFNSNTLLSMPVTNPNTDMKTKVHQIEQVAKLQRQAAQWAWGQGYFHDHQNISSLSKSLFTWGLTCSDIAAISFHGTSTKLNDQNESYVIFKQLEQMEKECGKEVCTIPIVCQKWLTGHPLGAAAAWMVNGAIQIMETGVIPGNRNLDDVDSKLEQYTPKIYFPNHSISCVDEFPKAILINSFGFGQAGAQIMLLHPYMIFSVLNTREREEYALRLRGRRNESFYPLLDAMVGYSSYLNVKNEPFSEQCKNEEDLVNDEALSQDNKFDQSNIIDGLDRKFSFESQPMLEQSGIKTSQEIQLCERVILGIGVDIQMTNTFNRYVQSLTDIEACSQTQNISHSAYNTPPRCKKSIKFLSPRSLPAFLRRNFTDEEILYCLSCDDAACSLAGKK